VKLSKFFNDPLPSDQVVESLFWLIEQTSTGRELLLGFRPLYRQKKIVINFYPESIAKKLRRTHRKAEPNGASFVTDGQTGVIYLDPYSPIGVLAPFLVHEIAHSLDLSLWSLARSNTTTNRKPIIARSEIRAHKTQSDFTIELKKKFPEFEQFLSLNFPHSKLLRVNVA
jgi:hypothetical protein